MWHYFHKRSSITRVNGEYRHKEIVYIRLHFTTTKSELLEGLTLFFILFFFLLSKCYAYFFFSFLQSNAHTKRRAPLNNSILASSFVAPWTFPFPIWDLLLVPSPLFVRTLSFENDSDSAQTQWRICLLFYGFYSHFVQFSLRFRFFLCYLVNFRWLYSFHFFQQNSRIHARNLL